jgi:hypothetical protein
LEQEKTHIEVKEPAISVRYLADYMAASERKRRTIVEGCKYRPIARLLQHKEARITISNAIQNGTATTELLKEKADFVRSKLSADEFETLTNEINADFLEKFSEVFGNVNLPTAEILPGKNFPTYKIEGVKISFAPNLLLRRTTKTNKLKQGALMLRYAKGKPQAHAIGDNQSAAIFGLLSMAKSEGLDADKAICITLDAATGNVFPAPGSSGSIFANMKAACATIAERWPNIKPPKGARI